MRLIIMIVSLLLFITVVQAQPQWLQLPPTPTLPKPSQSGYASINGVRIWYAEFGHGKPVILLHGGLANSNYWGNQVSALAKNYRVIVMDSRGHGRSTHNAQPYGYRLMASDVVQLMNFLKIKRAAIVGWSDGGIIGLEIAIYYPDRISKLFAFGANSDPAGTQDNSQSLVVKAYIKRAQKEYEKLSPTPQQFNIFLKQIAHMWATQPHITAAQFKKITIPVWIVDGDRDEGIRRENTEFMAAQIPGAGLLIEPNVSHFSFLQDSRQFNADILHFLAISSRKRFQ